MARTKNNFLNAKPVSKMGGGSGGVRKPSKPYQKPPAKSNTPKLASKTKIQRLQEAAKTKPSSPAPKQVIKKPVTRTGPVKGPVPPKGSSPVTMPNSRRAGVNLPQAGARAERTATRVADLRRASAPKPSAPSNASGLARGAGMAGRVAGAFGTALAIPAAIKNIADVAERNRQWDAYKERMGMNKPQAKPTASSSSGGRRTGSNNRVANLSVPTSSAGSRAGAAAGTRTRTRSASSSNSGPDWRSRVGSQDVNTLRQGQNDTIRSYNNTNKPSPARPSASLPSQSTPSRSTASGSGSQRSAAPQATKPAMPGRKFEEFNPGRGTSKSNNPLLDSDKGGFKLRDRMQQRESSQQSEAASKLSNKFGQDSGYQPQTKVDGSKYADKKPDMKKVNEYDRRKRRYYD